MKEQANKKSPFLGIVNHQKTIGHCVVALTSYGNELEQEEWHSHKNASLSLLLSGKHDEEINGRTHSRMPGDIKLVQSGILHRCNGYATRTCKINIDLTTEYLNSLCISEAQLEQILRSPLQAKFILLKLYKELLSNEIYGDASAELLLYQLLNSGTKLSIKEYSKPPAWAIQLKMILNDQWHKPFDLKDLADQIGVHPVTISRYFPLYFSQTLGQYINHLKIERSLPLIKTGKFSLTAIAYQCGFSDQAHFTKVFLSVTGLLPSHFRKI